MNDKEGDIFLARFVLGVIIEFILGTLSQLNLIPVEIVLVWFVILMTYSVLVFRKAISKLIRFWFRLLKGDVK